MPALRCCSCSIRPRQKTLPATDASSRTARSSGSRASRRAARMLRIVVGRSCASFAPRSATTAASSSMKNGLPSATAASCAAYSSTPVARQLRRELERIARRERLERQRRRREQSAAPGRAVGEELRPRQRDDQQRRVLRPRAQHLDQVEQARVGPVDVLEHEHASAGRARRCSTNWRAAKNRLSRSTVRSISKPRNSARLSVSSSSQTATRRSFSRTTSALSLSKISATCLTCCANAP